MMDCSPQQLIRDVQAVLRPDDLGPGYEDRAATDCAVEGFCAPAAEVLQALLWECGQRQWKARYAVVDEQEGLTHWWLVDPSDGTILDPTADQFHHYGEEPPYDRGRGGGFQRTRWPTIDGQKVRRPGERALRIISRIDREPARRITERFSPSNRGASTMKRSYRHPSGRLYRAIRREQLQQYEQLHDTELQQLEQPEFADLVDAVMTDLAQMEDAVRRRKQLFDRLKKLRLAEELESTKGRVVELSDMVIMLTEQPGRTSWKKLIDRLAEMRPELKDILEELQAEFTGDPSPMVKKYRRTKEPKKWKQLEHVPLREVGAARRAQYQELDERRELQKIRRINQRLDRMIEQLLELVEAQPMPMAAGLRRALSEDMMAVLNQNKQVQQTAKDVLRAMQNELVGINDQLSELSGATQQAPYAVVQNLEASLPEWLQRWQQVQQQIIQPVKQQLDEMAAQYEQLEQQDPSGTVNLK